VISVASVVSSLRAKLGKDGKVLDPALARAIIAREQEVTGEHASDACVVIRPPAGEVAIRELDAAARVALGKPLPVEVTALYRACDGIWAYAPVDDPTPEHIADYAHYEHGIRPIAQVIHQLSGARVRVSTPMGDDSTRMVMTALPLFDVPDQGWYALDPWRGDPWPMIAYWFDEVDLAALVGDTDARAAVTASARVIAPDLGSFLHGWLDHGCHAFWYERTPTGPFGEHLGREGGEAR
jgi:hypothetical protein